MYAIVRMVEDQVFLVQLVAVAAKEQGILVITVRIQKDVLLTQLVKHV